MSYRLHRYCVRAANWRTPRIVTRKEQLEYSKTRGAAFSKITSGLEKWGNPMWEAFNQNTGFSTIPPRTHAGQYRPLGTARSNSPSVRRQCCDHECQRRLQSRGSDISQRVIPTPHARDDGAVRPKSANSGRQSPDSHSDPIESEQDRQYDPSQSSESESDQEMSDSYTASSVSVASCQTSDAVHPLANGHRQHDASSSNSENSQLLENVPSDLEIFWGIIKKHRATDVICVHSCNDWIFSARNPKTLSLYPYTLEIQAERIDVTQSGLTSLWHGMIGQHAGKIQSLIDKDHDKITSDAKGAKITIPVRLPGLPEGAGFIIIVKMMTEYEREQFPRMRYKRATACMCCSTEERHQRLGNKSLVEERWRPKANKPTTVRILAATRERSK
ncbi:hypothetical protein F4778DRAFT_722455 [Xylariomycetidae sp. FL2044]|nr:hypothetical protein F4778DRAFT_722455 [Xylariomycetidae sp. FL2044]